MIRGWDTGFSDIQWSLILAAKDGSLEQLQTLLSTADDGQKQQPDWLVMPLHMAVREGHLEIVTALIEAGADPGVGRWGGDPLPAVARMRGHSDVAEYLDNLLSSRFQQQPSEHLIHKLVQEGSVAAVEELLLAEPQAVILPALDGNCPIHIAANKADINMVRALIGLGADINARQLVNRPYAAYGFTAIDLTLWDGPFWGIRDNLDITNLLLESGAQYTPVIAAALGDLPHLEALIANDPEAVNHQQTNGKRPLSAAAERGQQDVVNYLLRHGANPNLAEGPCAIHGSAFFQACKRGDIAMAQALLQHGADTNGGIDSSGDCLFVSKEPDLRQLLYLNGAKAPDAFTLVWEDKIDALMVMAELNPEKVSKSGCGGVFAAVCTGGRRDLLKMLLDRGVRVPDTVNGCRSYLWENPDMTRTLLEHGMDPNLPDWQHTTPLHNLCGRDAKGRATPHRAQLLDLFLEFGANINAIDEEYQSTPLAWAIRNDLPDMAELLIARGADPTLAGAPWAVPESWAAWRDAGNP